MLFATVLDLFPCSHYKLQCRLSSYLQLNGALISKFFTDGFADTLTLKPMASWLLIILVHYRNKNEFKTTEKFMETHIPSPMQCKINKMFLKQFDTFYLKRWFPTKELI